MKVATPVSGVLLRLRPSRRKIGKRQPRERRALIDEKGRHINRIKGMLAQQGVYDYEPVLNSRWKAFD